MSLWEIWDDFLATIIVCLLHIVEIAVTVALYLVMLLAGWWMLGWLARWVFGG